MRVLDSRSAVLIPYTYEPFTPNGEAQPESIFNPLP